MTIPQEIRRIMGLQPGDRVCFEVEGEVVKIRRVSSKILQWFGSVTPRNRPEDFREVREEFEKGVAEEQFCKLNTKVVPFLTKNNSFTDAYNAAYMLYERLSHIYSWDRDFDKIEGIVRLEPGDE